MAAATKDLAPTVAMQESTVTLRDVQRGKSPVEGKRRTPLMWETDQGKALHKHLSSAGILMDGGHDIVISKRFGCFLGYGGNAKLVTDENYQKIPMRRVRNVFGIDAYVTGGKKEAVTGTKKALLEPLIRGMNCYPTEWKSDSDS